MDAEVLTKLDEIRKATMLGNKDVWNVDDVVFQTGHARSQIYKFTHRRQIPFYKSGKFLYFKRDEITDWMLRGGKVKTNDEVESEAAAIAAAVRDRRTGRAKNGGGAV